MNPKIVQSLNRFKQKEKSQQKLRTEVPMTSAILEKLTTMNTGLENQCHSEVTEAECTNYPLCGWCSNSTGGKCIPGDAKGPLLMNACLAPDHQWHIVKRNWDVPTQVWAAAQMQVYADNQ